MRVLVPFLATNDADDIYCSFISTRPSSFLHVPPHAPSECCPSAQLAAYICLSMHHRRAAALYLAASSFTLGAITRQMISAFSPITHSHLRLPLLAAPPHIALVSMWYSECRTHALWPRGQGCRAAVELQYLVEHARRDVQSEAYEEGTQTEFDIMCATLKHWYPYLVR